MKESISIKLRNILWISIPTLITSIIVSLMLFLGLNTKELNFFTNSIMTDDNKNKNSESFMTDILVPNLVNSNFNLEKSIFDKTGELNLLVSSREYSEDFEKGLIINQDPQKGEYVKRGSVISVVLSLGTKIRILPDISNFSLSEASIKLSKLNLVPEKIEVYNDNVDYGKVIGYIDHVAGENVEAGTSIKIVVSKGKEIKTS